MPDNFYTVRGYHLQNNNIITDSMEDYMEMIYKCAKDNDFARVSDVSIKLNVKPSSCTKMVFKLAQAGYVTCQRYGGIYLTEKGEDYGAYLLKRHKILQNFFKIINPDISMKEIELMEHTFSVKTIEDIDRFAKTISKIGLVEPKK